MYRNTAAFCVGFVCSNLAEFIKSNSVCVCVYTLGFSILKIMLSVNRIEKNVFFFSEFISLPRSG
jgi:hypothetical protein